MGRLQDKRLFLLDMDGTIYLDDRLFDGVTAFLSRIREKGGPCYLANGYPKAESQSQSQSQQPKPTAEAASSAVVRKKAEVVPSPVSTGEG